MSQEVRQTVLVLLIVNVALQTVRFMGEVPGDSLKRAAAKSGPPSTRFPFATQERLASNATLFKPLNETQGFSIPELLKFCHDGFAVTITKHWAIEAPEGDHHAREDQIGNFVNTCFPLEMATNQGCRSMGFCSDYIQYIAHAGGRLVDQFGDSEFIAKRINCPNSTYLHGEYLTHPLLQNISKKDVDRGRVAQLTKLTPETLPESIPRVRNLWLPNLEQTKKEHLPVIPLFYKILCKTRITCTAIKQYIKNKNVKPSPIFAFMAHSSPDVLQDAETVFGESQLNSLRTATRSFNKFIHTYGKTGTKSTVQVVECWLQHPEWPQLLIVGDKRSLRKELQEKASQARNIVELDYVDIPTLRALQIEHGIAICSSTQEGYGHYINDARSMGSLLLTTNHPPMSEFVNGDGVDGILIEHSGKPFASDYQALSEEFKSAVEMRTGDICASVERVLRLNESERERIGLEGRKSFERDTAFMIEKMAELLEEAWQHLGRDRQSLKGAEYVS